MVAAGEFDALAADEFDTVTVISALESTLSLFSNTLQLASLVFQCVPGMAGVAGALSGVSSGFDTAGKVADGIDKIRATCDEIIEIYRRHPDPAANPQVARALMRKAFTLTESGRLAEAVSGYDDLVRRFAADTDPAVACLVRPARINATWVLNKSHRFEETLPRCGEIVADYGADPDPAVVVDVLTARLNRMAALGALQRTGEAMSSFAEIAAICDGFDGGGAQGLAARVRQDHATVLAMKSAIVLQQGKADEALAACDEITERFGADDNPGVRSGVTRCLLARAAVLRHLGRSQDEIGVYDEILAAYRKDRSLHDVALNAWSGQAGLLVQSGRFADAVRAGHDLRREFRADRELRIAATVLEIDGYRGLGQHKKAVQACAKVLALAGPGRDAASRYWMALALRLKARSLWALHPGDKAMAVWQEMDQRFGADPDLGVRREAAQALLDKGWELSQCGRFDDVAAAMDTIVARYGGDADPVLKEKSARAQRLAEKLRAD